MLFDNFLGGKMKLFISIIFTLTGSIACATSNAKAQKPGFYDKKDCDLMVSISLSQGFDKDESSTYFYKSSHRVQEIGDLILYDVYASSDNDSSVIQRWLAIAEKVYDKKTNRYLFCGIISLKRNKISFKDN